MIDLNIVELYGLKDLIDISDSNYQKLSFYIENIKDSSSKQLLSKCAQNYLNEKYKLMSFLSN